MNADAFRRVYEYHFTENRKIWDTLVLPLTQAQFTQPIAYSMGSVRNQLVHMMSCDDYWFSGLRGLTMPDPFDPADYDDRAALRTQWDSVEQAMRAYLAALQDEMLFTHPITEGEDQALILWEVLLHVVNHGTDHRAQLLRVLHDFGAQTGPQDYIFYVFDQL